MICTYLVSFTKILRNISIACDVHCCACYMRGVSELEPTRTISCPPQTSAAAAVFNPSIKPAGKLRFHKDICTRIAVYVQQYACLVMFCSAATCKGDEHLFFYFFFVSSLFLGPCFCTCSRHLLRIISSNFFPVLCCACVPVHLILPQIFKDSGYSCQVSAFSHKGRRGPRRARSQGLVGSILSVVDILILYGRTPSSNRCSSMILHEWPRYSATT